MSPPSSPPSPPPPPPHFCAKRSADFPPPARMLRNGAHSRHVARCHWPSAPSLTCRKGRFNEGSEQIFYQYGTYTTYFVSGMQTSKTFKEEYTVLCWVWKLTKRILRSKIGCKKHHNIHA
jgi:hypothetical protein